METTLRLALLVWALVVLCRAGTSSGSNKLDHATHLAAPFATYTGVGREEKWVDLDVYVSGFPSASAAVNMISDVYGWKASLFWKLADKVVAYDYYAMAPNYFRVGSLVNILDISIWIIKHPLGHIGWMPSCCWSGW